MYYAAHAGGYPDGRWCIIDREGKRLTEARFENINYAISSDGCFAFYNTNHDSLEDLPLAIYSIQDKHVLLEPQFWDVEFLENGDFLVSIIDEASGEHYKKVIDRQGKEKSDAY